MARSPLIGMTIVTGVRGQVGPTSWTLSSSSVSRIMSPAGSPPSGEASAVDRPSRAVPIAVIAPPPGERTRSPAKRSSPSPGNPSRPTKVMSRKAGTETTTSTLMGALSIRSLVTTRVAAERRLVDRLADGAHRRADALACLAERSGVRRCDGGLGVVAERGGDRPPALLELAQPLLPARVAAGQLGVAARAGQPAQVAGEDGEAGQPQQRAAERLVALQQQIGDRTRAAERRAETLGHGHAGDGRVLEVGEQLAHLLGALGEVVAG